MAEPILETRTLSRRFGGLEAVAGVSLTVTPGEAHCVIGPNGAGKTTFINLLSGDLKPTAGTIRFAGRDITGISAHAASQAGIGRSYQRTNIFPSLSVRENCWLAAQSRGRSSMRFFRPAHLRRDVAARADEALARCGLTARANVVAAELSHGEQRQLEIGMVLATAPRLLLLDEPMAGMSSDETQRMVALLRGLKGDHTLVLIEHDMDVVFALADTITVLVNGAVLETGLPAAVRASPKVREAYLGESIDA
jgi:branched-chain amino acid transport system ATP-binding protein